MKNKNKNSIAIENFVKEVLFSFGEDPSREGLLETPKRVVKMYEELLSGYKQDPSSVMKTFEGTGQQDLVTVGDINFYSLCEHHMAPFFGKVHIGYLPNGRVLGLSKFARLTGIFSRRLQVQERLTREILESIDGSLNPEGVIVHIEAEHTCMSMRGVKKEGAVTKTTAMSGKFETNPELVDRFFHHINQKGEGSRG